MGNKSAFVITNNPIQNGRTKHIKVKYSSIGEAKKSKETILELCN